MIALYLDYELNEEEREAVEDAVADLVECRRVPWLARLGDVPSANALQAHLQRVGIPGADAGDRVLLVSPEDLGWVAALAEALRAQVGRYPLLVQPSLRRAQLGDEGPLRVIDMEAYYRGEDADGPPPWARPEPEDPR